MQKYEMLYVLNPELAEDGKEALIKMVEETVVKNGGKVLSTEKWGMKKLQYPINFKSEGYYVLTTFESEGSFVSELKRIVGNNEGFMRRLITKAVDAPVKPVFFKPEKAEEAAEEPASEVATENEAAPVSAE